MTLLSLLENKKIAVRRTTIENGEIITPPLFIRLF